MKKIKMIAALLLVAKLNHTEAQNLVVGLQACYPLDNNATNMASTGNPLNGNPVGVTATTDRFLISNSAYAFAGTASSYISLPNDSRLKPNTLSFSAWVKFNNVTTNQYIVFTKNTCSSYHEGYLLDGINVGSNFNLRLAKSGSACSAAAQQILVGSTNMSAGVWYHVAFYAGNDSLKLFVNGAQDVAAVSSTVTFNFDTTRVYLGGTNLTFNKPLNGALDAVRFYNRKLGNNEFYQLYTSTPPCSYSLLDGLQACYPFDCDTINYGPTAGVGTSLNGTRYNVVCDTGHTNAVNTAYKFSGANTSYIKLPNDPRIKPINGVSFSAWCKLDANTAPYQYIVFAKNTCSSFFEGYTLEAIKSGSQIKYQVAKSSSSTFGCGTQGILLSNNSYNPFTWHHIVFYVDNAFIKLYVDGVLDNTMTSSVQLNYDGTDVILGGTNQPAFNYPLNGSMDNVRIYNRELTAKEINILNWMDPTCNTSWGYCFMYDNYYQYLENCHNPNKTVGLNEATALNKEVKLYPNPSAGKFYISNAKGKTIAIYDVNGKMVQHSINQIDETISEINLMNTNEGLYFVKIMDASGITLQTSKIVVTH